MALQNLWSYYYHKLVFPWNHLPEDLRLEILNQPVPIKGLAHMRTQDRRTRSLVDVCVAHQLNCLRHSSDENTAPARAFLATQGPIETASSWNTLRAVKERFGINLDLSIPSSIHLACEEASAHAVMALRDALVSQSHFNPQIRELANQQDAAAVRAWMGHPDHQEALQAVTILEMPNCELRVIPPEINKYLTGLVTLCVNNNSNSEGPDNQIQAIPENAFNRLTALERLNLSHNRIHTIDPNAFRGLSALQTLYLTNTQIQTLPDNIFAGCHSLIELYISHNPIQEISPNTFSDLTSLRRLFLDNNQIQVIPENAFANMKALFDLRLNGNQIHTIDPKAFSGLTALEGLDLCNNRLQLVPTDALSEMTTLLELGLGDNQLQRILENAFSGLHALQALYLRNSHIGVIAAGAFNGLHGLLYLVLSDNQLQEIPKNAFQGLNALELLDLDNNPLLQPINRRHVGLAPNVRLERFQ